jgi:hypothetical protein
MPLDLAVCRALSRNVLLARFSVVAIPDFQIDGIDL